MAFGVTPWPRREARHSTKPLAFVYQWLMSIKNNSLVSDSQFPYAQFSYAHFS